MSFDLFMQKQIEAIETYCAETGNMPEDWIERYAADFRAANEVTE